jgi:enterochelin esterase family protein
MKVLHDLQARLAAEPDRAGPLLQEFTRAHSFPLLADDTATFFFWDGQPADAVYLMHWVFGLESRQAFQRIEGTDAFMLSLALPHGSRIEYKLEVHRGGGHGWVRDPLNPRLALDPFGANSVCPMTGYVDPPWCEPEPGVREGRIETFPIASTAWGGHREIRVYLPYEYRAHKPYPLLVVHDGDDYLRFAGMKNVLDNLITRHEVLPLLVAFTSGHQRNEEYAANPRHARFVVEDVLDAVSRRYRVSEDPADRGLMGASFGGVSSLYTAWRYPGLFGRLLLQSGSFVFTDIGRHGRAPIWDPVVSFVNEFRTDPARVKARIYMSCGVHDGLIYYNRSLVPLLRESGLAVQFSESRDGHNWICWRDRLREGLTYLFPGHLWMYYD